MTKCLLSFILWAIMAAMQTAIHTNSQSSKEEENKSMLTITVSHAKLILSLDTKEERLKLAHKIKDAGLTVKIKIIREKEKAKNAEGQVLDIIERANEELVGTYEANKKFGFVILDDKSQMDDIYIDQKNSLRAKNGDKVVVEIISYPKGGNPEGKIIEIIGGKNDKNIDVLSIIRQEKIPTEFSKKTKKELLFIEDEVNIKELLGRTDFSELFTVTIDGRDSKDFDDAISIEKNHLWTN